MYMELLYPFICYHPRYLLQPEYLVDSSLMNEKLRPCGIWLALNNVHPLGVLQRLFHMKQAQTFRMEEDTYWDDIPLTAGAH